MRLPRAPALVSRTSEQGRSPDLWLDYEHSPSLAGLDTEARLSRLATWLLEAENRLEGPSGTYGLKLPGLDRGLRAGRCPPA
jgi:hypothetical protein